MTQKDISDFRESTAGPAPRTADIGDLLRQWRNHRNMSQMTLALDCGISSRHLSFIETGRARPSREVALRLGDCLQLSPQLRNRLLQAVGLAPEGANGPVIALTDEAGDIPSAVNAAAQLVAASSPFPAVAIDRRWTLVARNTAASLLLPGLDEALRHGPVNVLRMWLQPHGLSSRIVNLGQWRTHLIRRLERQVDRGADDDLRPMLEEMRGYASATHASATHASATHASEAHAVNDTADDGASDLTLPLSIRFNEAGPPLSFLGATSLFGSPNDVRCAQIAIASFLPSDANTRSMLTRIYGT